MSAGSFVGLGHTIFQSSDDHWLSVVVRWIVRPIWFVVLFCVSLASGDRSSVNVSALNCRSESSRCGQVHELVVCEISCRMLEQEKVCDVISPNYSVFRLCLVSV